MEIGFTPTETQYKKLCGNRLSKIVIREHFSTPKFKPGVLVQLMNKTPFVSSIQNWAGDEKGMVIEAVGNITKPVKGAKKYKVLLFGNTVPVEIEERFIKRLKKP